MAVLSGRPYIPPFFPNCMGIYFVVILTLKFSVVILLLLFFQFFLCFILLFIFFCLSFYNYCCSYLLLLCGDIECNPGPTRMLNKCRVFYHNIRGLYSNISDLQVASKDYDIILCSETLVSSRRNVSELLLPGFNKPTLLLRNARPRVNGLAVYIKSGYSASVVGDMVCKCHEIQLVRLCSRSNNFYIFSVYRNPDLDDSIYDCLMSSMCDIQERDKKSGFVFVGDFNAHHRVWLNSISATDRHGIAAFDFCNLSGCVQLINEPTHHHGNTLDLLLTDVPGVVESRVVPPLGSSDHSALSFTLKLGFKVPNVQLTRKVFLKSRVDWHRVIDDVEGITWSNIYNAPDPIIELNNVLVNIIERRVPTKNITCKLKDKAWFNADCLRAFNDKQNAYRLWSRHRTRFLWDEYLEHRRSCQAVYDFARSEYNNSIRDSLLEATQSHKWWSVLKSFLFGVDTSLPPIRKDDGSVTYQPSVMAEVFSSTFQKKQCGQVLTLPPTCFPQPKFTRFAFKSSELKYYLSDLDSLGGLDPNNIFPLFLVKIAKQLAPKLACIFRRLLASGSFPELWRSANVTPIPKGSSPTQFPSDYRPISITPILSKIYEKLIYRRLYKYVDSMNILPSTQFGFRKGLGTTDALLVLTQDLQLSLDKGAESRVVSLDFSSAFDLVNHQALLYKLKSVGVGGVVFDVLKEFLSDRMQRVSVDGSFSNHQKVISGVPQGSVLGPLLFILFTADMWNNLENKIVAYADDTTLYSEIASPSERSAVADSLNRDLLRIQEWCCTWGMKLNPTKTHSIIISRSRTPNPPHLPLNLCGSNLEVVDSLKLLGITIDDKLTFEKHIRLLASSIAQKTGLLRKCYRTLGNDVSVKKSFFAFILPCFEYCAPVWSSAASSHLKLLDRALRNIRFFLPDISLDLERRRNVAGLSLLYKIYHNFDHPLHSSLPAPFSYVRPTRFAIRMNDNAFCAINARTSQYARSFIPAFTKLWNSLPNETFQCSEQAHFKSKVRTYLGLTDPT